MSVWQPQLRRKLGKRARQLFHLGLDPVGHWRFSKRLEVLGGREHRYSTYKYLGDYLALPMKVGNRRRALISHYEAIDRSGLAASKAALQAGILLWQGEATDGQPRLRIYLEPARLAPMEGELQLRFAFRSDLFFLTFILGSGEPFDVNAASILYIGGAQGGYRCRAETREAAKLNGEISPAAMLMIAVQALVRAMRVEGLIAVNANHQIARSYAHEQIKLDYHRFWTEAGGTRDNRYYYLPRDTVPKSLGEVSQSHRSRTRRKREAKAVVRAQIEQTLTELMYDAPA